MLDNLHKQLDTPHAAPWAALFDLVEERYARHHLRRLFAFCSARNVMPGGISQDDLDAFGVAVIAAGIDRPNQVVRDAVRAWTRMASTLPDWPQVELVAPSHRCACSLPLEDFPVTFQVDVEAFLHQSSGDDLFAPRHTKRLSQATMLDRRNKLRMLATILVGSGRPVSSVQTVKDLVSYPAGQTILAALWDDSGRKPNGHCYNLARLICGIAKHWAKLPQTELELLKNAESKFRPTKVGMTERNHSRLRKFTDPANVTRLLAGPMEAVARLDVDQPRASDAITVQSALAVALLLAAPIRAKNLAGIDLDKHIVEINGEARVLVIPAKETKNDNPLEFPLPPELVELLELYLRVYRPMLEKKVPSRTLFISRNGRSKTPAELGAQIPKFLMAHLGIEMNLHLFRHFAAFVFLSHHPGEYETVRQLLGHKSLRSTVEFYTRMEGADAARRYDGVLNGIRDKARNDG